MIKPREIKQNRGLAGFEFSIFHLVWGFLLGFLFGCFFFSLFGVFLKEKICQLPSLISVHQVDYSFSNVLK